MVESVVNPRYKSTVRLTGGALKCRRHFNAERRERRRPAEASPLCQTRRWTRLFRKFTVAARERQAATRGARLWLLARRWTRRTWAIHPPALSRLLRGVASRDQPVRHRWGLASRRLCRGAEPLVFRSHVAPSGEGGSLLVHVGSVDPREPHRRQVRWG